MGRCLPSWHNYIGKLSMAGSNKWFIYTADNAEQFALFADESNTEAINGAVGDYVALTAIRYSIPKNLRPRYAAYQSPGGERTIICYALTPAIYASIPADFTSIPDPLGTFTTLGLARIRPEIISPLPKGDDTGIDDGDGT
jgi:hypothetical protein